MEDVDDNSNSDFVDVEDAAEVGSAAVEDADDSFAASKYLAFVDASDGTDGVDVVVVEDVERDAGEDVEGADISDTARCLIAWSRMLSKTLGAKSLYFNKCRRGCCCKR